MRASRKRPPVGGDGGSVIGRVAEGRSDMDPQHMPLLNDARHMLDQRIGRGGGAAELVRPQTDSEAPSAPFEMPLPISITSGS